jgi:hypothetical protein
MGSLSNFDKIYYSLQSSILFYFISLYSENLGGDIPATMVFFVVIYLLMVIQSKDKNKSCE